MYHSPYATRMTVYGVRNMDNNKPYRTAGQKAVSDEMVRRYGRDGDGAYRSGALNTFHPEKVYKPSKAEKRHAFEYFMSCGLAHRAYLALD
jgi:hypothetical protein